MSLDENWNLLSNLVHKAIKTLEKRNIKHAEAFFTSTETTEVTIRNSEIQTQNRVYDSGVGFRVAVVGDKVGFACTNTLNEKAILEAGEKAFAIAKVSSKVPNLALPEPTQPPKVKGLYDSRVAEVTVEEAVDMAERMIAAAEESDRRVTAKDGRVLFNVGWRGIINTLGIDLEEKETKAVIYLGGAGKQNGEVTSSCYDFMLSRTANLEPEKIGRNVRKMVVELFKPQPVKSFQGTAIFGYQAVSYQLVDVLIDALKGETVLAGRSAWAEKLGEQVASENLTVTDNAVLENGFASRSFDDEGCSSQKTIVIRKGRLESFLHHATSAKTLGVKNTGNASRFPRDMIHMIIGTGYRAKPHIYPSNLIIRPGNKTKEDLISEVTKGVLIESMAGFAQKGSGIISAQLTRAFLIQNGEIKHPIKNGMTSGIAFKWLKQITEISKDTKQFPNAVTPTLRIENVKIICT